MRFEPRMVVVGLLLLVPMACTEAPQFMKEEQGSGAVIFAGQFAQGSMFRDNSAPASAYAPVNVAANPEARPRIQVESPNLPQRTSRQPSWPAIRKVAATQPASPI